MASYVERILVNGEEVKYQAKISIWSLLPLILLGVLLAWVGIGLIFLLAAYLKYISTELAITNKRIIAKFGFISRRTVELNLNKVESIQVDQSIIGRMFDFGSLVISGAGTPQAPIPGISAPILFRKAFVEIQES